MSYRIFTDATADLSPDLLAALAVTVIPMEIMVGEEPYTYGPEGNITVEEFYAAQRSGKFASTSQINPTVYERYFEPCLAAGEDVLYLCFTSGLSSTLQSARMCAEMLGEKYPEREIRCVDTLCASIGEGLLVYEAAQKQAAGLTLEELTAWVLDQRTKVCHWFTVDTFEHLRHGGRVSAAAAVMGTALQIKPLLRVSDEGTLEVVEKPRGQKRAVASKLTRMETGWEPGLSARVIVGHGGCPERAAELVEQVKEAFPQAEISVAPIGPVIGSHTGPGMLALVYWGKKR